MKYIFYILGIIVLMTCALWAVSLRGLGQSPGEDALIVNERVIPFDKLQQRWQQKPYHFSDQQEFIDDQVLRELLIQQAITAGIAEEDSFRQQVQEYFEQSLVSTLLDRKMLEQAIEPTEQELTTFRNVQRLHYQLTLLRYDDYQQALDNINAKPQALSDDYSALTETIKVRLLSLGTGEISPPFVAGSDYLRIRIEQAENVQPPANITVSDAQLRQQLQYLQQQKQLEDWLLQIRRQAKISYPNRQLEKGGN